MEVKRGSVISYISHTPRLQGKEETDRDLMKGYRALGIPQEHLLGHAELGWVPDSMSTGLSLFSTSGRLVDVGL